MATKQQKGKAGATTSSAEGKIPPLTIENAKLIYKNFAGSAKRFNAAGLRNFHIVLDTDTAKMLENDGWNIKWTDPKEDDDLPMAHIKVAVGFDNFPPRIVLISGKNGSKRSVLDAESVDILDWAEIERADIVLSGSRWEVQGKHGIKAWLRKAFITLSPDDLESKYAVAQATSNSEEYDD